jgi:hypothetical protein
MSEPTTGNIMNNPQVALNNAMSGFSSPQAVETTDKGFLNSNGIIAKVVFLIMVVIIYVILFFIVVNLISYFTSPSGSPLLINGQIDGTKLVSIPQNPANSSSKPIMRSNNRATGIEFTWAVWLNYADSISENKYSPVFVKGDISTPNLPYCSINHGPGVYFGKKINSADTVSRTDNVLYILFDTPTTSAIASEDSPSIIVIPNLPVNTYFHLAIRCQNTYIDIYINGTLVKRQNLMNVPKQNYYDLHVCPNGGFNGKLSNLQYFDKSLTVVEINSIVQYGPNQRDMISGSAYTVSMPNIISTSWYNSFLG